MPVWNLKYRPGRTQITLLSNMSPVSASFIIQHITFQIFLLLLALRPCCQPSVSEKKKPQSSFYLASTAVHSSVFLSHTLSATCYLSVLFPHGEGRCLKNSQFFSFLLRFFLPPFPLEWKHCMKLYKSSCVGDTQRLHCVQTRNDTTPLYSTKLSTYSVALCHFTQLWCMHEIKTQNLTV